MKVTETTVYRYCQGKPEEFTRRLNRALQDGTLHNELPEVEALYGREERGNVGHKENFSHTLQVMANCYEFSDGNTMLVVAAMLHDIGKPPTKRFFDGNWTFHGHERVGQRMIKRVLDRDQRGLGHGKWSEWLQDVIGHAGSAKDVAGYDIGSSAIRRWAEPFRDDQKHLSDVICLAKSDMTTSNVEKMASMRNALDRLGWRTVEIWRKDREAQWRMEITGYDLIQVTGIKPGPDLGRVLKMLEEEVRCGDLENDKQALLKRAADIRRSSTA